MTEGPVSRPPETLRRQRLQGTLAAWTVNVGTSYPIDRPAQPALALTLADTGPALRRLHAEVAA